MTGASFKVIADEGMKLTQLKVDGYQTSKQLNKMKATCGMRGKITLTILADDGSIATDDNGDDKVYYNSLGRMEPRSFRHFYTQCAKRHTDSYFLVCSKTV